MTGEFKDADPSGGQQLRLRLEDRRDVLASVLSGRESGQRLLDELAAMSPLLLRGARTAIGTTTSTTSTVVARCRDGRYRLIRAIFESGGNVTQPTVRLRTLCEVPTFEESDEGLMARLMLWLQAQGALPGQLLLALQRESLAKSLREILPDLLDAVSSDTVAILVAPLDSPGSPVVVHGPITGRQGTVPPIDLEDPFVCEVLRAGEAVSLEKTRGSLPRGLTDLLCPGWNVALLVPSITPECTVLLMVSRRRNVAFGLQEADLLATACRLICLSEADRELRQEGQERSAVLRTAWAASRAISRSLDLDQAFQEVVHSVTTFLQGSNCLLLQREGESGDLVAVASSEYGLQDIQGLKFKVEDLFGRKGKRRQTHSLQASRPGRRDGAPAQFRAKFGSATCLVVPMFSHDSLIGGMFVYSSDRERSYAEAEIKEAEEMAQQAVKTIVNARLYHDLLESQAHIGTLVQGMATIRDHERQRFARVVHDDIIQTVAGAVYELEAFRDKIADVTPDQFDNVLSLLRASIDTARRVVFEMRPPVLDQHTLAESLQLLCELATREGPSWVRSEVADVTLSNQTHAAAFYRIAREGVRNARQHARATEVVVSLAREDHTVVLRVTDDGVGFDVRSTRLSDHFGLVMMEEQAALMGAPFRVTSFPGRGTVLEVRLGQ
jgi:signal transduction histidine kinase